MLQTLISDKMDLEDVCSKVSEAGEELRKKMTFEIISMQELSMLAQSDEFAMIIKTVLELNDDCEMSLYLHQYQALHALAEGKDVLLISPCGSGKTRVLLNAPGVVKMGFELKTSTKSQENPLAIVCCPLTSIMEDKLKDQPKAGMLSMSGSCQTGASDKNKVSLSKSESEFMSGSLSHVYGHPESFATEIGKKILETQEGRIAVFICDEVGFNVWGIEFRPLMSTVPGAIRVFSDSNAPMLCMSATVGKSEQIKIMNDLGMTNREVLIIEQNPVMNNLFLAKVKRPSNQKGFYESGGLKDILSDLYLNEFILDPEKSRKAIIFCKNEEDLIKVYEYLELEIGNQHLNMKNRPWVQYHASTGEKTLTWIHKRLKGTGSEVKLLISTYKLIMGVDLKDFDLAIFLR